MNAGDATRIMPRPGWGHSGAHLLDDAWLLVIFAILFATALPWLVSDFDVDFLAVSLGLLALGAIHFGFSTLGRLSTARQHRRLQKALHAAGVCIMAFVWMNAAGPAMERSTCDSAAQCTMVSISCSWSNRVTRA